jgi:transcription elongation factor Elf1
MTINFECKKCRREFDCEVGKISLSDDRMRPVFEKDIICPRCGELSKNDVFLTELGQSQMTEATWDL